MGDDAASAEVEAAFARQEQIWAAMYGPAGAAERLAKARARLAGEPEATTAEVFRAIDDDDDDGDADEAGLSRPGFG